MAIATKRIYDPPSGRDGYRVLVDRLWPRGLSKEDAALDEWLKDIAPADQLRTWFHGDRARWGAFRRRYLSELKSHRETLRELARRGKEGRVTLLFGSRDEERNNAVVVAQYLNMLGKN